MYRYLLMSLAAILAAFAPSHTLAAGAANNRTVLVLASTVGPEGMQSEPVRYIQSLGYDVELATNAQWASKSTADFATYRAIVLADPECIDGTAPIAAAEANTSTWGPAVTGPMVIVGTDAHFHTGEQQKGAQLMRSGISYALSEAGRTGLYVSLSCYYNESGTNTTVRVLSYFGRFVVSENTTCHDDIHITAPQHPAMAGLTDASLSNWNCSIHALFTSYPGGYDVLAIADNLGTVYTDEDGSRGTPYILARGAVAGSPHCPAPTITINSISPSQIWPPNNKFVNVRADVETTGTGITVTRTITSSDGASGTFYQDGADVYRFKLLASRSGGNKAGRTYTITYTATDACGNTATAATSVLVPHDQGKRGGNDTKSKRGGKGKKGGDDDRDSDSN